MHEDVCVRVCTMAFHLFKTSLPVLKRMLAKASTVIPVLQSTALKSTVLQSLQKSVWNVDSVIRSLKFFAYRRIRLLGACA